MSETEEFWYRCGECKHIFSAWVVRHRMYWCPCGKGGVDLEEYYTRTSGDVTRVNEDGTPYV